jgi:hypothetical protein
VHLVLGLKDWATGMRGAVAQLVTTFSRTSSPECQAAVAQVLAAGPLTGALAEQLLGGNLLSAFDNLFAGFVHLAGKNLWLESGTTENDAGINETSLVPPHPWLPLPTQAAQQMLGTCGVIATKHQDVIAYFGKELPVPVAIGQCSHTFKANIGLAPQNSEYDSEGNNFRVEDAIAYIDEKLQSGVKWGDGIRQLVSLYYRGSVLYSSLIKLLGMIGESYKYLDWAARFIEAADKKWKVVERKQFKECGSAFQHSIRRAVDLKLLTLHHILRGSSFELETGAFPIKREIELCVKVVNSARDHPPWTYGMKHIGHATAFHRLPLATAHTHLASVLMEFSSHMRSVQRADGTCCMMIGQTDLVRFIGESGLLSLCIDQQGTGQQWELLSLVTQHYQLAASAQLKDASDAAILWWGYAANMARAEIDFTTGKRYTLGQLRHAIKMARAASAARHMLLCGPDIHSGGSYEKQALCVAHYLETKDDADSIPPLQLERGERPGQVKLTMEGVTVCDDMERFIEHDARQKRKQPGHDEDEAEDALIASVENEHGPAQPRGPLSLKVSGAFSSCVRPVPTEIYLCNACSCQEFEDEHAAPAGALRARAAQAGARMCQGRGRSSRGRCQPSAGWLLTHANE